MSQGSNIQLLEWSRHLNSESILLMWTASREIGVPGLRVTYGISRSRRPFYKPICSQLYALGVAGCRGRATATSDAHWEK